MFHVPDIKNAEVVRRVSVSFYGKEMLYAQARAADATISVGMSTVTIVPRPGSEEISSLPP